MSPITIILFIVGLFLLLAGADVLIRGASALAARFGVSPLLIGLTVVSLGTSAPEIAVSVTSAFRGETDMALGNVVGSNIFNVLAILGMAALVAPLVVQRQLIRLDVPIMILASIAVYGISFDGVVSPIDGVLLMLGMLVYTAMLVRIARRSSDRPEATPDSGTKWMSRLWVQLACIAVGLVMLVIGSGWLVDGATTFARMLGVSELVIGLTIIAAGTSLPELATSVLAVAKGERDIAVGNVVGSNTLNLLLVLGCTSTIAPGGVPVAKEALHFDIPVMVAVAVACLPSFITGSVISRWEGAFFLGYYIAYTTFLILVSQQSEKLGVFQKTMLWFVIPLTVIVFLFTLVQHFRQGKKAPTAPPAPPAP